MIWNVDWKNKYFVQQTRPRYGAKKNVTIDNDWQQNINLLMSAIFFGVPILIKIQVNVAKCQLFVIFENFWGEIALFVISRYEVYTLFQYWNLSSMLKIANCDMVYAAMHLNFK